jgi:outer membrane biosynthesis protein TonB
MAFFSLFIHLIFFLLMTNFQSSSPPSEQVEVEYISKNQQQIVTQTEIEKLKNEVEELKRKTDFLSQQYKRVKKQTRASNTGATINKKKQARAKEKTKEKSVKGLERMLKQRPPQFNVGDSTISEHIPGVDTGHFTALDSDPFTYYGFYSRVHKQIRNRWVPKIINIAQRASNKTLRKLSQKPRQTIVEIILDKDGYFVKALILKSSSYDFLDQAAIAPFQEASPLLNPPAEMIQEDGFIHIKYGFYLSWNPRKVVLK